MKLQPLDLYQNYYFYDQGVLPNEQRFVPFALSDAFTLNVGEHQRPYLHFWQLPNTVILGMKDSRLPELAHALNFLQEENYHVMFRSSGGLGIVADADVLNFSLIIPQPKDHNLEINPAYEIMTAIIQEAFHDYKVTIEAKEIVNSYCPGDFDLSINDQKFAGIAQRRIKNGISVMIYLSVNGNQHHRSQLMHDFYAKGDAERSKHVYPLVESTAMANLSDLLGDELSVADVKRRIKDVFIKTLNASLETLSAEKLASEEFQTTLAPHLKKMAKRNESIFTEIGEQFDAK